ncbi:MAG: PAS domain S-box protein [Nitrospinae bacterium]|nr:PAS domain S-box protein [Nitrospinota bacterium]MDA1110768.1 PAS domain S-box protein [Nitrospinota bacterium]
MLQEAENKQESDILQQAINLVKENQRLAEEKEKAEEQLQQANRQNQLILNSAGEGIYGLDLEGNTTFANPAAEKMLGYAEGELLGKPQHAIIHHSKPDGSPYPRDDCHIYAAIKDGRVHRETEEVFWRKDGTSFPVEYVSTPIRENEKLVGAVVTFKDITERKKAEAQQQMQYELTRTFLDSESLEDTFPRILQAIGEFMEWEISHYWEKIPESDALNCRYAWNAPGLNESVAFMEFKENSFTRKFEKGTGLPGRVWDRLEPSWIADVRCDTNFPRAPFAKKLGMRSGFGFLIFYKKQFMGVIEIFTRQVCQPEPHLIEMMANLGEQIGQWMRLKKAEEHLDKLNLKTLD